MRPVTIAGTIKIIDDRGQSCPLTLPPDEWPKLNLLGRPKQPPADPSMIAELNWARKASGTYGGLMGFSLILPLGVARWLLSANASWPAWVAQFGAPFLGGILCWPALPFVNRVVRRRMAADLRAAYLKASRCASCGFDLKSLHTDADGFRRCPECGASWRDSCADLP
jgi:hypothetical protein